MIKCTDVITLQPTDIFNAHYKEIYSKISNTAMTNEAWQKAHDEASEIFRISEMGVKSGNHNSTEYFELVRKYYYDILTKDMNLMKNKKKKMFNTLNATITKKTKEAAKAVLTELQKV